MNSQDTHVIQGTRVRINKAKHTPEDYKDEEHRPHTKIEGQ